ncbi:MAG TPA: septum formation initiator family protein [Alphaproteobacteria bacterium]|nr:septum formation initiator family protein [Alphaproteobacteria bacterium]
MVLRTRLRRRTVQVLGHVIAAALVGYFAYYTVEGERGLFALARLRAQATRADAEYATLKAEREALQLKVTSLRPDSLDLDRLDERTRALLNDSRPDELIINLPKSQAPDR